MRLGKIGLEVERLAVAGYGLLQSAKVPERIAEVVMRFSQIWRNTKRIMVVGDRLLQPAKALERKA